MCIIITHRACLKGLFSLYDIIHMEGEVGIHCLISVLGDSDASGPIQETPFKLTKNWLWKQLWYIRIFENVLQVLADWAWQCSLYLKFTNVFTHKDPYPYLLSYSSVSWGWPLSVSSIAGFWSLFGELQGGGPWLQWIIGKVDQPVMDNWKGTTFLNF